MMASNFTLKCSSCDLPEDTLYSCETCEELIGGSPEPESSLKPSKKRRKTEDLSKSKGLCDSCILQHIRKDHEVKNLKGQTPVICSVHKNLHSEFCRTGDVTFCLKCLGDHRDHQLGSVEEREKELRKEIFEILTESEMSEKPLQSKLKSSVQNSGQEVLEEFIKKESEDLRTAFIAVVSKKYKCDQQKGDRLVEQVGSLQSEARNLLSLDGCQLKYHFQQLKSRSLECTHKADSVMSDNLCEKCDIAEIGKSILTIKNSVIQTLESNLIGVRSDDAVAIESTSSGGRLSSTQPGSVTIERYSSKVRPNAWPPSCYRLVVSGGAVLSHEVQSLNQSSELGKQLRCRVYRKKVRSVSFDLSMTNIFIISDDGSVDSIAGNYDTQKLDIQIEKELLCVYIFNQEIHQCYWNSKKKTISLTHCNKSFHCEAMPVV